MIYNGFPCRHERIEQNYGLKVTRKQQSSGLRESMIDRPWRLVDTFDTIDKLCRDISSVEFEYIPSSISQP